MLLSPLSFLQQPPLLLVLLLLSVKVLQQCNKGALLNTVAFILMHFSDDTCVDQHTSNGRLCWLALGGNTLHIAACVWWPATRRDLSHNIHHQLWGTAIAVLHMFGKPIQISVQNHYRINLYFDNHFQRPFSGTIFLAQIPGPTVGPVFCVRELGSFSGLITWSSKTAVFFKRSLIFFLDSTKSQTCTILENSS